jgi:cell division protein ZapA (FtsZ GTPase activity inhibitor)
MGKTIKTVIGGREYNLKGEDESIIKATADEVNSQLENLGKNTSELQRDSLPILAALNIAESKIKQGLENENNNIYLTDELNKMSDLLINSLKQQI